MKKCPNCGKVYSDFVNTCSACNTPLTGANGGQNMVKTNNNQYSGGYDAPRGNVQTTNTQTTSTQTAGKKNSWSYILGVVGVAVAFALLGGESVAFYIGALLAGIACGCVPFFVGRSRGKEKLAMIGMAVTTLVGFLFGLVIGAVSAAIFTVIILVK